MASNDEVAPRIKLDPMPCSDNSVRSLNRLFPKIDNLEYFPLKVLLQIFALVDDFGLVNLADNSTRFEKIAKMVLNERYAEKYLIGYASTYNSQRYDDFLRVFGNNIKSIHTMDIDLKGENNWTVSLLNRTTNIKKLKLELLRSSQSNEFLLQECVPSGITHLTLCIRSHVAEQGFVQFVLSKFRDLKKFKLIDDPCISWATLRDVIHNNLGLESFCIADEMGRATMILKEYPFDKLMVLFGAVHLNQLKEFAYLPIYGHQGDLQSMLPIRQPDHIVDAFVGSLKHLESLALSVLAVDYFTDPVELLYRIATQCRNIKHLELHCIFTYDEVFEAIKLFKRIESLSITSFDFEYNSIVSLVEKLPFLHHLHIKIGMFEKDWSFVLVVISKCLRLEKLTVSSNRVGYCFETFQSAQFFNDFRECVQTRNVTIEVVWRDVYETFGTIGTITKDQVIWRKKLVRWVGYDPNRNSSQTNLMHLVNQSMTIDSSDCETQKQHKPFARILDYLDLNSLQSLSKTNGKCSQLIDNYVKQYSKQQGTFTITNEFFTAMNLDYKRLDDELVDHVFSLRVNIRHHNINELRGIIQKFPNLTKLYVYVHSTVDIKPTDMIIPQVRHFIFDGPYFGKFSKLYELSCLCPDLEILELKRKNLNDSKSTVKCLEFRKLQKFTFKYWDSVQLETIQALFKDTNTELNVVYDHTN